MDRLKRTSWPSVINFKEIQNAKKAARADISDFKVDPAANGWQKNAAVQLDLKTVSTKK
jgi:hypothetical protein